MKKVLTTIALAFLGHFAFAATPVETIEPKMVETQTSLPRHPSGSGTITDACGNTYEIEWSCNYNCNGLDVISAIMAWGDDNTDCGFDSYQAD